MINLPDYPLKVKDLKEGDLAIIEYDRRLHVVYIFKPSTLSYLSMVSLTSEKNFWSNISTNDIKVVRKLKKGELLEVD